MKIGVMAIAWTLVIDEIIAFCFNVYPVKKYIGFNFKMHLQDALPSLMSAIVMATVVICVGFLVENTLIALIMQVFIGGVVYVALSIITKNESFGYLKELVTCKFKRG